MSSRREGLTNDAYTFKSNTDVMVTELQYKRNEGIILRRLFSSEECILYSIQFSQVILR